MYMYVWGIIKRVALVASSQGSTQLFNVMLEISVNIVFWLSENYMYKLLPGLTKVS